MIANADAVIPRVTRGMYDQNMTDHTTCCKRTELFGVHPASDHAISAAESDLPVAWVTNPCIWSRLDDPRFLATLFG